MNFELQGAKDKNGRVKLLCPTLKPRPYPGAGQAHAHKPRPTQVNGEAYAPPQWLQHSSSTPHTRQTPRQAPPRNKNRPSLSSAPRSNWEPPL